MHIRILSLFPSYFVGPFDESMVKRAKAKGLVSIDLVDIRAFAEDKHRRVDDRPYGGGPGMVLMAEPIVKAIRSVRTEKSKVIYLAPQGEKLTAAKAKALAHEEDLILLCGHYEGVDERAIELEVDELLSVGDYILTSGCPAAAVVVDALIRFIPGVLGDALSCQCDSFEGEEKLLEGPQYTRPEEFEGKRVPSVLLSGHHEEIASWRESQARERTEKLFRRIYEINVN